MTGKPNARSLIGELKRRHVFKVGATYAVVAFVVIQAAEVMADALSLPTWTLPFITVLAILGFPLALVLAWAFDLTEQGVRRDVEDTVASDTPDHDEAIVRPRVVSDRSVAVLPFANLSGEKENEYFSDGITEDIITGLSRMRDLHIISRTSVMRYKGSTATVREIAEELGVATVLEGSVRRADGRVRISAQLIDARQDRHLWVETYDHRFEDVFSIQSEVAREIAQALAAELSPEEKERIGARPTVDVEAYDLFLKGRYLWNRRTEAGLDKSIGYYRRSLERDPNFALAEAGLADSYVTLGLYGHEAPHEVMPRARDAATHALALDSRLAEALTSLATVRSIYDWDWQEAERDYRRAIDMHPQYPVSHHWLAANLLTPLGRFEEAQVSTIRALELDPLSAPVATSLGMICLYSGRCGVALEELSQVVDLHDRFGLAFYFQGLAFEEQGRMDDAIETLEKADALTGGSSEVQASLGHACAKAGDLGRARSILESLERRFEEHYGSPALLAQVHLGLGDEERALDLLEKAAEMRAVDMIWLGVRPVYRPLADNGRFRALLDLVGVS
jgi:TolB-like protein/Flp pilus assembly protein TadD